MVNVWLTWPIALDPSPTETAGTSTTNTATSEQCPLVKDRRLAPLQRIRRPPRHPRASHRRRHHRHRLDPDHRGLRSILLQSLPVRPGSLPWLPNISVHSPILFR